MFCIENGLLELDARTLHKQNQIFARNKTEGKLAASSGICISINLKGTKIFV
jgi:hypothetical protein